MKRRAELEEQTRLRITESAVALHGSLGPARTSMSAVAEHAGVTRSTLYRHFPDEEALFDACSSHWAALHPPPDLLRWAAVEDRCERLRGALGELYAFYGRTEPMMAKLLRDAELVPSVARRMDGYRAFLAQAAEALAGDRRERAAIGHALAFSTWRSLTREQGLDDAEAIGLMQRLAACP